MSVGLVLLRLDVWGLSFNLCARWAFACVPLAANTGARPPDIAAVFEVES